MIVQRLLGIVLILINTIIVSKYFDVFVGFREAAGPFGWMPMMVLFAIGLAGVFLVIGGEGNAQKR